MLYIIHSKCYQNVHSIIAVNDMKYTHFMKREEHCRVINLFLPLFVHVSYMNSPVTYLLVQPFCLPF